MNASQLTLTVKSTSQYQFAPRFQLRGYIAFSWLFDSIAIERHRLQRMGQHGKRWQTKCTKKKKDRQIESEQSA